MIIDVKSTPQQLIVNVRFLCCQTRREEMTVARVILWTLLENISSMKAKKYPLHLAAGGIFLTV
jgi:hypothetical protein